MEFNELKHKISDGLAALDREKFLIKLGRQCTSRQPILKDTQFAEKVKSDGNKLFGKLSNHIESPLHYRILHLYNKSIAYAPIGSEEQATSYSNKSALLKRMRKYSECLSEINKGIKISQLIPLKIKLLCRKAECLTALGSGEGRGCLEKARHFLSKLENGDMKVEKILKSLIDKTQQIVDEGKLDTPKINKRKTEALREIAEAEKRNIWSSVEVGFSEKHGRYLVAKQDFKTGEILYVEKPYRSHLEDCRVHQNCCHCFNYLWTILPCDHCPWRAFCSDECKSKAWDEYHQFECSVFCQMRATVPSHPNTYYVVPILMTIFFKALKEAGSISQMQTELKSVDECIDTKHKGFSANGEFSSYKSLYSLPIRSYSKDYHQFCIKCVGIALSSIARYTQIFGRTYDFNELKKLRKNDDAMFVAAFLYKIHLTIPDTNFSTQLFDPSKPGIRSAAEMLEPFDYEEVPDHELQTDRTVVLTPALIYVDCLPNVQLCVTFGSKFMVYALQPIKAGTKLSCSSPQSGIYDLAPKSVRQAKHQKRYNCPCECQACRDDWSEIFGDFSSLENIKVVDKRSQLEEECSSEVSSIMEEWQDNATKQNYPGIKQISRLRDAVAKTWKLIPAPSMTILHSVGILRLMYQAFYNPSETYLKNIGSVMKDSPYL